MVTKAKKSAGRKKHVKVLSLKKETVKNLRGSEAKRVKGGIISSYPQPVKEATLVGGSGGAGGAGCIGVSGTRSTFNFDK